MLGPNQYEAGLAINCLANIITADLARDLAPDLVTMLTSNRPYIRKKAVLVLYKVFLKYPEALRPSFNRLKEKLEDPDPSVVSAAVNVVCELARKNPQNYMPLAPTLFKILTTSVNNWMLIKIIKLFSALTPHEPRLAKKLIEPLTTILNTPAMSLLYEAIQCCITGLHDYEPIMKLCLTKLRMFVEHPDQNLKYLGLVAMAGIMQTYPKGVAEHRDLILTCLEDDDTTIRMRALQLITGMVNKKNLQIVITKLLEYHAQAEGQYKDDLLERLIYICSQQNYKFVADFEWYVSVLIDLTQTQGSKQGSLIRDQLLDVCVRVEVVRAFAVEQMIKVLRDTNLMSDSQSEGGMCEVLTAAAWVVGEYLESGDQMDALDALLQPRVATLPPNIQTVYVQNVLKVFVKIGDKQQRESALAFLERSLPPFVQSPHLEVQERACFVESLLNLYKHQGDLLQTELAHLFDEVLKPVAPVAQSKVPVPEGLDLDAWINPPPKDDEPSPFGPSLEEQQAAMQQLAGSQHGFFSAGSSATPGSPMMMMGGGAPIAMGSGGFASYGGGGGGASYGAGMQSQAPISGGPLGGGAPGQPGSFQPVDMALLERRRQEYMAQRAGNPLYLQGGSQAMPPPVERLDPLSLGIAPGQHLFNHGTSPLSGGGVGSVGGSGTRRSALSELMADRERKDKKDKKHKKRGQAVAVLGEEDMPEGSPSTPSTSVAHSTPTSSAHSTPGGNNKDVLDINLNDISPLEQLQHRQHRQVSSSSEPSHNKPSSPSPASPSSSTSTSGTLSAPSVASPSSKSKDKDSSSRHKHKDKKHKHKGGSSSSSSSSKETTRTLYKDSGLVVTYDHGVLDVAKKTIFTKLTFKNKSNFPVFGVELDVNDAQAPIRWARPSPGGPQAFSSLNLPSGASDTVQLTWNVSACSQPLKIGAKLSFVQQKEEGRAGVPVTVNAELIVPCSAYLLPQQIDQASFVQLLRGPLAAPISTTALNNTVPKVIEFLNKTLGMYLIESSQNRGSLYCKSILGHDIAALVKEEGAQDSLALAVKASDEVLGQSLIREIATLCSKKN